MIVVERSFKYLDEIELSFVRGIGEKKFASLKKSKLKTVADLIRYFPRTHIDRSKVKLNIEKIPRMIRTSWKRAAIAP